MKNIGFANLGSRQVRLEVKASELFGTHLNSCLNLRPKRGAEKKSQTTGLRVVNHLCFWQIWKVKIESSRRRESKTTKTFSPFKSLQHNFPHEIIGSQLCDCAQCDCLFLCTI